MILYRFTGTVEKTVNDYATVNLMKDGEKWDTILNKKVLEPEGVFRNGARFEMDIISGMGTLVTTVKAKP